MEHYYEVKGYEGNKRLFTLECENMTDAFIILTRLTTSESAPKDSKVEIWEVTETPFGDMLNLLADVPSNA